jgi:hypothetical protein
VRPDWSLIPSGCIHYASQYVQAHWIPFNPRRSRVVASTIHCQYCHTRLKNSTETAWIEYTLLKSDGCLLLFRNKSPGGFYVMHWSRDDENRAPRKVDSAFDSIRLYFLGRCARYSRLWFNANVMLICYRVPLLTLLLTPTKSDVRIAFRRQKMNPNYPRWTQIDMGCFGGCQRHSTAQSDWLEMLLMHFYVCP